MSDASRGELAHATMAPSVLDWMAIHESRVAVVGKSAGAYGETGARGHGRVKTELSECQQFDVWSSPPR